MQGTDVNKKDQWSVHLEYLKVAVTLATGILALAAVMYSDVAKLPTDCSKYILLVCAASIFVTLIASVLAIISLANWVAIDDTALSDAVKSARKARITRRAGASFYSLIATGFFLLAFFAFRTFAGAGGVPQAIDVAPALVDKRIDRSKETALLQSFDVAGDKYNLVFRISPGTRTFTIVLKPRDHSLLSINTKD